MEWVINKVKPVSDISTSIYKQGKVTRTLGKQLWND